jgi:hypothetical protein
LRCCGACVRLAVARLQCFWHHIRACECRERYTGCRSAASWCARSVPASSKHTVCVAGADLCHSQDSLSPCPQHELRPPCQEPVTWGVQDRGAGSDARCRQPGEGSCGIHQHTPQAAPKRVHDPPASALPGMYPTHVCSSVSDCSCTPPRHFACRTPLQVASYKYLARYTPGKDIRKPTDRSDTALTPHNSSRICSKRLYANCLCATLPRLGPFCSTLCSPAPCPTPASPRP